MLSSTKDAVHSPENLASHGDSGDIPEANAAACSQVCPSKPVAQRPSLLHRADQAVVAALVACSLVAVFAYWHMRGGTGGELIEIETDVVAAPNAPLKAAYRVDLNDADWPELDALPGVGERLARRIVESRAIDGPFRSVDDLERVRGVGAKTVERLRPYLRVGP